MDLLNVLKATFFAKASEPYDYCFYQGLSEPMYLVQLQYQKNANINQPKHIACLALSNLIYKCTI